MSKHVRKIRRPQTKLNTIHHASRTRFEQVELATESWNDNISHDAIATAQFSRHSLRDSSSTFFLFFFSPKRRQMRRNFILGTFHFVFTSCKKSSNLPKIQIRNLMLKSLLNDCCLNNPSKTQTLSIKKGKRNGKF